MKPLTYSLIAAALACGFAAAQTTAYTTPVGYVSLPAVPANSDVFVSIPLDRSVEFTGTVASVAGNVITISGTPNLVNYTTAPHTVKIGSGAKSGMIGLITANDATTVTVAVQPGDALTGIVAGDSISINKAWTVLSVMGTKPAGTQLLGFSGTSTVQNPASDLIYEFDGTNWIDTNSFEVADNTVLFPNETLVIRNVGAALPAIVLTGQVPIANSRVLVINAAGGTDNMVSYFGAVGEVIGTSGLSAVAAAGDQVLAFDNAAAGQNKAATTIVEWDGAAWIDTNSFEDVTSVFKLESGVGYVFRRAASTPVGAVIWSDTPNYVPSL